MLPSTDYKTNWSMLLATHRCASDEGLIQMGIPITEDGYYARAYTYAPPAEKVKFAEIARAVLLAAPLKIYRYAVQERDGYLCRMWMEHYQKECGAGDLLLGLFPRLQDYCEKKVPDEYVLGLSMDFYGAYENAVRRFQKTCSHQPLIAVTENLVKDAAKMTKESFQTLMDTLYQQIAKSCTPYQAQPSTEHTSYQLQKAYVESFKEMLEKNGLVIGDMEGNADPKKSAELWADPCGTYNKLTGGSVSMMDWDGCGVTVGQRWLSLANKLWTGTHKENISTYRTILSMCSKAEAAGVDGKKLETCRNEILNGILASKDLKKVEVEFVLKECPNHPEANWKYLLLTTNKLTQTVKGKYDAELKKGIFGSSEDQLQDYIQALENNLKKLDDDEAKLKQTCRSCVDEDAEYAGQCKAYLQRIEEDFGTVRKKLSKSLAFAQKQIPKARRRKVVLSIVGFILFALLVCGSIGLSALTK